MIVQVEVEYKGSVLLAYEAPDNVQIGDRVAVPRFWWQDRRSEPPRKPRQGSEAVQARRRAAIDALIAKAPPLRPEQRRLISLAFAGRLPPEDRP